MKKILLVRVGIDTTQVNWNSPVNTKTGDFVYIPIIEEKKNIKLNYVYPFNHFIADLKKFSLRNGLIGKDEIRLPDELKDKYTHLDPDFNFLTYGDNSKQRGKELREEFGKGDCIVFYSGMKPIKEEEYEYPLFYAIIGFYEIERITTAGELNEYDRIINAHTRRNEIIKEDVIVIANPEKSGRLERCIEIGEYREKSYRIKKDLLEKWGGITNNNGYIQRSAYPPKFKEPDKFLDWFYSQDIRLVNQNNI